jgi:transglutaminase-like putative cysteine protease
MPRWRDARPAVAAGLLAGALVANIGLAQAQSLALVPLESRLGSPPPDTAPLRVELQTLDPARVAAALGLATPASDARTVIATLREYRPVVARTERDWLQASFVIDHDEPDVAKLHAEFVARRLPNSLRENLITFTADVIDESLGRGWDFASTVARRREGDCTEHAVLLAALARRSGVPARVVVGVAIVPTPTGHEAWGHAWTELQENGGWQLADAALATTSAQVRYIPYGLLENEGPGFMNSLGSMLTRSVQRVTILEIAQDD